MDSKFFVDLADWQDGENFEDIHKRKLKAYEDKKAEEKKWIAASKKKDTVNKNGEITLGSINLDSEGNNE